MMPRCIQSLNDPKPQPQYAAAAALDRTRGAMIISTRRLRGGSRLIMPLSFDDASQLEAQMFLSVKGERGVRASSDRCRFRIVVMGSSARCSLTPPVKVRFGKESMTILQ
jgi:hypothetical protein